MNAQRGTAERDHLGAQPDRGRKPVAGGKPEGRRPDRFAVWAPRASRLTLLADGRRLPMERIPAPGHEYGGWWHAPGAPAAGEVDYGYLIDDDDVIPDPRSRRQPDGVHKLSRTFDPSGHRWADAGWRSPGLGNGIIYELHVGTFTPEGTFDAVIGKLDYLAGLGVDFVELLPVNAFNGVHNWGYDGVLWYAVHEAYGGPAGYQRLVDAAHRAGLGIIQDVVYNHLGASGNYLPRFGPYLSDAEANTWGDSVNLDGPGSDEVRRYILDNARMWFSDYHVDGLRLDAVHALRDSRAVHLLEDLSRTADDCAAARDQALFLIAESDLNNPRLIEPRSLNGYGLSAQWNDDFHHAAHVNLTGETAGYYADFDSLAALAKVLRGGFFHDGSYSSFRHRRHGRPIDPARVWPRQLVVNMQNHDQIGNRAAGDRLSRTLNYDRLAVAAVLTMTSPFTPMLFMGEEYAATTPWQFFTSHPEPDLGAIVAAGRLEEFERMGWDPALVPDPQDPATFERSKLDWSEIDRPGQAAVLRLYRQLAALRRRTPELWQGSFSDIRVDFSEQDGWLTYRRGALAVFYNFRNRAQTFEPGPSRLLLVTSADATDAAAADGALHLPGVGAVVVRVQADAGS